MSTITEMKATPQSWGWLSLREAAKAANISYAAAKNYIKPGGLWEGIAFNIGRRVKLRSDELETWLMAQRRRAS